MNTGTYCTVCKFTMYMADNLSYLQLILISNTTFVYLGRYTCTVVNDVGAAMAQSHLLGRGHRPYLVSRGHRPYLVSRGHRPYLVSTGGTCRTLYKQGAQAVHC